ncbi:hypothetical protein L596_005314 [Steinernema carpocapsae]|uniref:Uncharacterized protein n=1 Tax=Steinernema carpocapsae TaxID=34508 RepID=A0A4U8UZS4_STECR|nr:hypothetical protein L596_005314 [Steinernema carpocapsae]
MAAKLRQHSLSSVRKLQELVNDCNAQLASFRSVVQCIGTSADNSQLRKDLDASARACIRACEACTACVLPQVRHEGVEFTRNASQFIGCVNAVVIEMKRCEALEATFPASDGIEPAIVPENVSKMEEMLEALENLITVHFSTSESSPAEKVVPHRRSTTTCHLQCVCSKLKTSYA